MSLTSEDVCLFVEIQKNVAYSVKRLLVIGIETEFLSHQYTLSMFEACMSQYQ